jgi:hypothetical protein
MRENLLRARTLSRSRQILNAVAARIEALPPVFLVFFEKADFPTQKLINLIAIMRYDSLFFDFVYEVFREKLITGDERLAAGDMSQFFKNKQVQSEKVASWTPDTFNRISRAYRGILLQAGLLKNGTAKERIVEKPILNAALADILKENNMGIFITALTGENL